MITDKYFYYWYIWIIVTVITVTVILLWVSSRGCTRCKIPLNPLLYVYMLQQLKYILRQGGWYFPHLLNPDNKRNNTLLHCCLHFFLLKSCSDRYCYHDNCTGFLQLSCAKSSFQVTDVVQLEPCMQWVATNILCTNTDAFQHWPDPRTYQGIQQWACCSGYYVSNKYAWVSKVHVYIKIVSFCLHLSCSSSRFLNAEKMDPTWSSAVASSSCRPTSATKLSTREHQDPEE